MPTSPQSIDGYTYTFSSASGSWAVKGNTGYDGGSPLASLDGYPVTDMTGCFKNWSTLMTKAPKIPESVTVMNECFYGCTSLVEPPEIPEGVAEMNECFYGCTSLASPPAIPDGVVRMNQCFSVCRALAEAPDIPSSVATLELCFAYCSSLAKTPAIADGVTNMYGTFANCTSLVEMSALPATVTNMAACFDGCRALSSIGDIPNGVTDMSWCFRYCESLARFPKVPESVAKMTECFRGCTSLRGVIEVGASPSSYDGIFADAPGPIYLAGSGGSNVDIAAAYDNVSVWNGNGAPTCSIEKAQRCNAAGETDPGGVYANILVEISWSSDCNELSKKLMVTNRDTGVATDLTDIATFEVTGEEVADETGITTQTCTLSIVAAIGEPKTTVYAEVSDSYERQFFIVDSNQAMYTIPKLYRTLDFLAGGYGAAFGKRASRDGLDIAMKTYHASPLTIAERESPPFFAYDSKPAEADVPCKPCIVAVTSDGSLWLYQ